VTPDRLVASVVAMLPPDGGTVAVAGADAAAWRAALEAAGWRVPPDGGVAAAVVVSFLGERGDAGARAALLDSVRVRLPPAGWLVVVDHNRPRRPPARLLAIPGLWARGLPAARASYPTAREIATCGFVVTRLDLAGGERVQVVLARPRAAAPVRTA
jgi:hypothetical protein